MRDEVTVNILKALADPTRLDIVRQLTCTEDGSPCREVRKLSSLSQPTMSHHFAKLVDANIVLEHKTGKEKVYELNKELLQAHGLNPDRL